MIDVITALWARLFISAPALLAALSRPGYVNNADIAGYENAESRLRKRRICKNQLKDGFESSCIAVKMTWLR